MLAALTLIQSGDTERKLFLYDTFAGMPEPAEMDVDYDGNHAACRIGEEYKSWDAVARASVHEVRRNLGETGYPSANLVFTEGRVEQTIPATAPDRIAILRLDTDWYASTRHELEHLYPLLSPGGVLIIDDYGHWKGCRRAVDEYLQQNSIRMMLHRVDYTGRFGIKP